MTAIASHQDFYIVEVPTVSFLLDTKHDYFTFDKSWLEAQSEPLFVVHTSGSTGMPKPLVYTHATAAANINMMSLDPPSGYKSQDQVYQGKRVFVAFPPFHVGSSAMIGVLYSRLIASKGAYLVRHLFNAVPFGTTIIAPTSSTLPSGEGLVQSLRHSPADVALLVPSIVQDLAQNPRLLDYCSEHLKAIMYCGGDLPQAIGDIVASKISLFNQFGASELGLTPNLLSRTDRGPEDWKYVQFHPQLGLELRHISDGIHELYAVKDPEKESTQPTFTIFPELQEYASRDLFVRHPSRDLWSWHARADDIIVFLNGEKTNPISMEQHIVARNADVSAALVIGAQRFQAALLIEPVAAHAALSPSERAAFIKRIWPTVEEANKYAPAHARLMTSHILFTQPHKPMSRAGKGTIQRSGTLKAYASEIDAVYRDADMMSTSLDDKAHYTLGKPDEAIISEYVRKSVLSTVGWPDIDVGADLFALGMDSLHALSLVRKLRQFLDMPKIALSTIYTNPSIQALTAAIISLLHHHEASEAFQKEVRTKERNSMIKYYEDIIDKTMPPLAEVTSKLSLEHGREIVILTGSTGTLGSYILNALLRNPSVGHIYCLNRSKEGCSHQVRRTRLFGVEHPSICEKVSFWTVDLNKTAFNLTDAQYRELFEKATLVIHNAWTVNFNLPLPSFKPQLDGVVNLLAFAHLSQQIRRFFYVSSISSVISVRSRSGKIAERPVRGDFAPAPNGYAESKYIAEQIIDYAGQKVSPGMSLAFARVGQVAGAANHSGMWNKHEWFPSMIISSVQIGALPDWLGFMFDSIDWIPVDLLAEIIIELALAKKQASSTPATSHTNNIDVYHPLNSHMTSWTVLKGILLDELSPLTKKSMEVVPLREWIAAVRKQAESATNNNEDNTDTFHLEAMLRSNPAVKLIDFYEHLLASQYGSVSQLDFTTTLGLSKAMQDLEPLKRAWVRKWIQEWFAPTNDHEVNE